MPKLPDTESAELEVEVQTTRTLLVPISYFIPENASRLLAAAGIAPKDDETVVWSEPQEESVALMALPRRLHAQVEAASRKVRYTTPLLAVSASGARSVWLYCTNSLLYIKVFGPEKQLQLAEVIPGTEEPEMRYFLERLSETFPLKEYTMTASGMNPKRLCKLFGRFFKKTSCA